MLDKQDDRSGDSADKTRAGVGGLNSSVLMASLVGAILLMIVIATYTFR